MPPDGATQRPVALQVSLAPDLAALEDLRGEWSTLWTRSGASPFQAPACLLPWAQTYAADRTAGVLVRHEGRLVGLAPVFSWEGRLLLAGTGPTDYNDALFDDGLVEADRQDAAALVLAEIAALADARDCRVADLRQLRPESTLLRAATPVGWTSQVADGDVCPVAPLLGYDGLGALPPKYPRKVRYSRRRCELAGGVVEHATAETLGSFWLALQRLHAKRWRALGEPGVMLDPLMHAFLDRALPELLEDGLLRLAGVRIDGELCAVLCALAGRNAWCFYLTGFDPDRQAVSPGTTLIATLFGDAAREGAHEVQLLRGQEPYKYHWGAVDHPTFRRTMTRL